MLGGTSSAQTRDSPALHTGTGNRYHTFIETTLQQKLKSHMMTWYRNAVFTSGALKVLLPLLLGSHWPIHWVIRAHTTTLQPAPISASWPLPPGHQTQPQKFASCAASAPQQQRSHSSPPTRSPPRRCRCGPASPPLAPKPGRGTRAPRGGRGRGLG